VRLRWPVTTWLVLLVTLAVVGYAGMQGAIRLFYPLEYRSLLFQYAKAQGLDPFLVAAVVRVESGFRPDATSPQGARGLMQIMPETGRWIAAQLNLPYTPELLYDPDYNLRLGCWYLASLQREFGDMTMALAAYNGGRNNVRQWLLEQRWTGEPHRLEQIPFQETRAYVAKVLRDHQRYRWLYAWQYGREQGDAGTEFVR
jgi:soluble lytic murein transglycosylase